MNPLTKNSHESVAALGESALIESITGWLGDVSPPSPRGIGDDCAILGASKKRQVITVDSVIYGRHFDDTVPPRSVGAKLLKRNLSDIAAMGASATIAVIALMLDTKVKTAWLRGFYEGLAACAKEYRVSIVGGDIAQAPGILGASLTLLGEATGPRLLTRKGAKSRDWIYVTGELGGSLLGHHYRFTPRLREGSWLARELEVRSMMDLSDGLAKDLCCLTPANTRPAVQADQLPISGAAGRLARKSGRPLVDHALSDGEDYELIFTLSHRADQPTFERRWHRHFPQLRLSCIGQFVSSQLPPTSEIDLASFKGYEHLR